MLFGKLEYHVIKKGKATHIWGNALHFAPSCIFTHQLTEQEKKLLSPKRSNLDLVTVAGRQ